MGRNREHFWLFLIIAILLTGCSASKNYERAYRRAWRKIVNSQAWRDALVSRAGDTSEEGDVNYPLLSDPQNIETATGEVVDEAFLEKYRSLVFRAYFRTIAEAEKADARISRAYSELRSQRNRQENRNDPVFKQKLELAANRYRAHRAMLEGLRSWKAFNEYGSDDLDFFLREHLPAAYRMHRNGRGDEAIISFLVYRLADLYHFEEN